MTNCTSKIMKFQGVKGRKVQAFFSGQTITSDAGALLLKDADLASNLTHRLSRCFTDTRRKASCNHSITTMLRQRVYGLALGYEDLNDHNLLRHDSALQTVIGQDESMASASTLCRFENNVDAKTLWKMSAVLIDLFIESHKSPPPEIVLDFDATNDAVHGNQEGRFFHGYYDHYGFLPLYVFCGSHLLAAYLRPSNIDAAKHAHGIAGLLVKRLRQAWPHTRIILRADSGFCRWKMLRWCDKQKVDYIIGIGQNSRLLKANHNILDEVKQLFLQTGTKQKRFTEVIYAAKSWDKARRIITKAEHLDQGSNPRFVVTSLDTEPEELYQRYCARGEMENRIKEQQLYLFADRTSCHKWLPNQLRLLLSGIAYSLLNIIREKGLAGTELAHARCDSIRLKLLKIGACIIKNSRRVVFMLSASYPYQALFRTVVARLQAG